MQAFETEGLIGTGAAPAVLTYLFHRIEGRLRRPADAAHPRRRLARPRRPVCRPAPRMAEDAAQEERRRRLRHPVARRHRRQRHRAGDHRELPDAPLPAERARARAADRRDLSPLRAQRPADRDPRAARRPSATTTASRAAATACSSSASARSRSPSPPRPRRPTRPRSTDPRRARPRRLRSPPGCAARALIGRPTCSPDSHDNVETPSMRHP